MGLGGGRAKGGGGGGVDECVFCVMPACSNDDSKKLFMKTEHDCQLFNGLQKIILDEPITKEKASSV